MTWQSKSFVFVILSCSILAPRLARADGLRIEDAVHLALQNNERARKAPLRVEAAEGQLDRALDAFFPTVVANGVSTLKPEPPVKTPALTHAGTVTLSQPLLNPSAFPLFRQQEHTRESEKLGAMQDKRQLAFDTAKAFVQVLATEGVRDSAKRKADTAKLNLEQTQARAQAGLTSSNDVTRAQLQLATASGQVATSQGNVEKAYLALGYLVGQKVDPPLVPPDSTTTAARRYEEAQRTQPERTADQRHADAITAAEQRRPDVRSLHEKAEALRFSAQEPMYRMIPTVSAAGQMRFVPEPLVTQSAVDETVTLNLTWNIFDSGFRYADRRTRLAQAESAALDEHLLRRSVAVDVDTARAVLHASRASVEAATGAVASAKQNVEETLILYRQGLARAIEVTDANDQQFQAEVTLYSARLTMEQAYLDLRNALGYGPLDEDMGTGK